MWLKPFTTWFFLLSILGLVSGCATTGESDTALDDEFESEAPVRVVEPQNLQPYTRPAPVQTNYHQGNKVDFTHELRQRYGLSRDHMMDLQYYLSGKVTLQKVMNASGAMVQDGRLITQSGQVVQEVVIPAGTPGVALDVGPEWVRVSFEEGTYLDFGSTEPYRYEWGSRYALLAEKWRDSIGWLVFNNERYHAVGESDKVYLLIDQASLNKASTDARILKGRSLYQSNDFYQQGVTLPPTR